MKLRKEASTREGASRCTLNSECNKRPRILVNISSYHRKYYRPSSNQTNKRNYFQFQYRTDFNLKTPVYSELLYLRL